ncbi:MAG: HAMP domain-containing protein, partial [Chloroflexota bacterium]
MTNFGSFFRTSFQRKLLLFNILLVSLTTIVLFVTLILNFRQFTNRTQALNIEGTQQTVEEYLTTFANEKAESTWLQIKAAQDNLTILGQTSQKIVDNYDELQAHPELFELSLFDTTLTNENGALTTSESKETDAFIPPQFTSDERAQELLEISGLLNLNIDAIQAVNENSSLIYYVGDIESPVTRAYPNKHLVGLLGEFVSLHFWNDFFPGTAEGMSTWFTDPAVQASVDNPIVVIPPYLDAAGQGEIMTMFYPLWDYEQNQFAGAVGTDLLLNPIIQDVLSVHVAESGFGFLMNGQGEIIAMPQDGLTLFEVNLEPVEVGGLTYYSGSLDQSTNTAVQSLANFITNQPDGIFDLHLNSNEATSELTGHFISFASLPPLSDSTYQTDEWRIVIVVPEAEIYAELIETQNQVQATGNQNILYGLGALVGFLVLATMISTRFSNNITSDLRTLVLAADKISDHNFDVEVDVQSQDELGQLGNAFGIMTQEIKDYTENLEAKVADRTYDLQKANDEIKSLNAMLRDENGRLSAELEVAQQLQQMVLPSDEETANVKDLDIAGYMKPADEVGGDYYDVLQVGDSIYLGIGDVTGHGLSSGVVMLMAQTAYLTLSQTGETDLKKILAIMNQVLYQNIIRIQENKNLTLSLIQYKDQK